MKRSKGRIEMQSDWEELQAWVEKIFEVNIVERVLNSKKSLT